MKRVGTFLFMIFSIRAMAFDCPDLRVIPLPGEGRIIVEGAVMKGRLRTGLRKRDRLRSLFSSPAAQEKLSLDVGKASAPVSLDDEGRFSQPFDLRPGTGTVRLLDSTGAVLASKEFGLPVRRPGFIAISDIDDTILVSEIRKRIRLLWNALIKPVTKRRPVQSTPGVYRSIAEGNNLGPPLFFYVSASPAAMGRFLAEFLTINRFPAGTLCIKNSLLKEGFDAHDHKMKWLNRLAGLFPKTPFLLLGDSGEKDPEIYSEFALASPTHPVLGILIRRAEDDPDRTVSLKGIGKPLAAKGISFTVWESPSDLASCVASFGFRIPHDPTDPPVPAGDD